MESRDLNFDLSADEVALREAIAAGGGAEFLDPLAWALDAIKRPRDLTQDQWLRAYTLIQDHRIRVGGPLPGDVIPVEANTGWGGTVST